MLSTSASSSSAANDDVCAVCLDSLALKRIVTLHPCNHRFHRSCINQWFEAGKYSQPKDFKCVLCRTESDKSYDETKQIVPRIFPFELSESIPEHIRQLPNHEDHLAKVGCEIFQTIDGLRNEKRLAQIKMMNEEFITDIKEEIRKLQKRVDAVELTFVTLALEENTELVSLEEEKTQLEEDLEKIGNSADKRSRMIAKRIEEELDGIDRRIKYLEDEAGEKFWKMCLMARNNEAVVAA